MESKTQTIQEHLARIQKSLKVAKNQRNTFGNYNYRSCEDILEAVKPLLEGCTLVISDEVVCVGARYYVKSIVTLGDGKNGIEAKAYARESEDKKGMDSAQITGAASSYARKYALNGLFAIDDTQDADTKDNRKSVDSAQTSKPTQPATGLAQQVAPIGMTACSICHAPAGKQHATTCTNNSAQG